jgi:hypothetical protein
MKSHIAAMLLLCGCASSVGSVQYEYDAGIMSDAACDTYSMPFQPIKPIGTGYHEPTCLPIGTMYEVGLAEVGFGTCGFLLPNEIQLQSDGLIFVPGAMCQTVEASDCTITNNSCAIHGEDYACSINGSVQMMFDGARGTGYANIACYQEHCVENVCVRMTIMNGRTNCEGIYLITMIRQ